MLQKSTAINIHLCGCQPMAVFCIIVHLFRFYFRGTEGNRCCVFTVSYFTSSRNATGKRRLEDLGRYSCHPPWTSKCLMKHGFVLKSDSVTNSKQQILFKLFSSNILKTRIKLFSTKSHLQYDLITIYELK